MGDDYGNTVFQSKETGKLIRLSPHSEADPPEEEFALIALSADGRTIARLRKKVNQPSSELGHFRPVRTSPILELWETASCKRRMTILSGLVGTRSMHLSPDGTLIATGDYDGRLHLWDALTGQEIRQLHAHDGDILCVRFDSTGSRLVTGGLDTTAVVWDVPSLLGCKRPAFARPRPRREQLERWWEELASEDATVAYRAGWSFSLCPRETVPFLASKWTPAPAIGDDAIARLVSELRSKEFRVRSVAEKQLFRLADRVVPRLRRELEGDPPLELKRRVERLLEEIDNRHGSPELVLEERSLEILERIASPAAQELLQRLAEGTPDARLTRESKASLLRIRQSTVPKTR
jgi:hypothetical protein